MYFTGSRNNLAKKTVLSLSKYIVKEIESYMFLKHFLFEIQTN